MIKIIGVFFLIAGFSGLSYEKMKEESEKMKRLIELKRFGTFFFKEIQFSHIPIPDICTEYLQRSNGAIKAFLENVCRLYKENEGKSFDIIWIESVRHYSGKKEEQQLLINLCNCFGFCNVGMQTAAIEQYLEELEKLILQKEKKFQDNRKLILYFGVMSGLLLSIILL